VRIVLESVVAIGLTTCGVAFGSDFCALSITVVSPNGLTIPYPLPITLVDSTGRVEEQTTTRDGKASFCDFGFGDHTVIVGSEEGCGSVVMPHIRLRLGSHQELKIVHNICSGVGEGGRLNCAFYLRIRSDNGQKLAGAELWSQGNLLLKADQYGRALVPVTKGTTREYEVRSPCHQNDEIHLSCTHNEESEREVILHSK